MTIRIRRCPVCSHLITEHDDIGADPGCGRVWWPGYRSVSRAHEKARILAVLLASRGRLVRRAEFVDAVYGDRPDGGPITAGQNISRIIFNLREQGMPLQIRSRIGRDGGYTIDLRVAA